MPKNPAGATALIEARSEAFRLKDIDLTMSLYAPDIVYFDLVPPLRYAGAAALRQRFTDWFSRWQGGIGMELRDLQVDTDGEVAAACMLLRASGTLTSGREVDYWVRTTNACRRAGSRWLFTQEHVSLPVDLATGKAVMDLLP
jgi:ketosteroid isomerase-like protein